MTTRVFRRYVKYYIIFSNSSGAGALYVMIGKYFSSSNFHPHSRGFKVHSISVFHSWTCKYTRRAFNQAALSERSDSSGFKAYEDEAILIYFEYRRRERKNLSFSHHIVYNFVPALPTASKLPFRSRNISAASFAALCQYRQFTLIENC